MQMANQRHPSTPARQPKPATAQPGSERDRDEQRDDAAPESGGERSGMGRGDKPRKLKTRDK
jgi:hypothetical protein